MCDPVTIATTLAIASTTTKAVASFQQAKGQRKALEASATQQASEQSDAEEVALGERIREGRRERARLKVAGGEAGLAITSNSFEAQIADSFSQQGQDAGLIRFQGRQAEKSLQARVDSQAATITGDSPLAILSSGLQIAGSGFGAFNDASKVKPSIPSGG